MGRGALKECVFIDTIAQKHMGRGGAQKAFLCPRLPALCQRRELGRRRWPHWQGLAGHWQGIGRALAEHDGSHLARNGGGRGVTIPLSRTQPEIECKLAREGRGSRSVPGHAPTEIRFPAVSDAFGGRKQEIRLPRRGGGPGGHAPGGARNSVDPRGGGLFLGRQRPQEMVRGEGVPVSNLREWPPSYSTYRRYHITFEALGGLFRAGGHHQQVQFGRQMLHGVVDT